jgi:hypothetical protein
VSGVINIEDYTGDGAVGDALRMWDVVQAAFARALVGSVTYVYLDGNLIATVTPPEAGERYEHANAVMAQPREHEATVPVVVRAQRRRRRLRGWSPFEGLF